MQRADAEGNTDSGLGLLGTASEPRKFREIRSGCVFSLYWLARNPPSPSPFFLGEFGMRHATQCAGMHPRDTLARMARSQPLQRSGGYGRVKGDVRLGIALRFAKPPSNRRAASTGSFGAAHDMHCETAWLKLSYIRCVRGGGGGSWGRIQVWLDKGWCRGGESTNLPWHSRPWRPAQFGGVRPRHQCAYPAQGRRQGARARRGVVP